MAFDKNFLKNSVENLQGFATNTFGEVSSVVQKNAKKFLSYNNIVKDKLNNGLTKHIPNGVPDAIKGNGTSVNFRNPDGKVNPKDWRVSISIPERIQKYMGEKSFTRAEATEDAVASWYEYVLDQGKGLLSNEVDSWMTGVNSNLEGRQKRIIARYSGSQASYRSRCDEVAASGYAELNLL